jgi:4-methylaminobutanoate oxidase (formaldehyde-forming)
MTYVGELGYELYVPSEAATMLYETLHGACDGTELELRDCGYYAIDSLRTEKGYRAWGHELSTLDTPLQAGLGFTIDWSKDFIGKEMLLKQKEKALRKRLVNLATEEVDIPVWGGEPILRDGEVVGNVTSSNYAHSVSGQVAMGYIEHPQVGDKHFLRTGSYSINDCGTLLPAKASLRSVFDPKGERVRA